jgi:hypothetical protein
VRLQLASPGNAALEPRKTVGTEAVAFVTTLGSAAFSAARVVKRPVVIWTGWLVEPSVSIVMVTVDAQTLARVAAVGSSTSGARIVILGPTLRGQCSAHSTCAYVREIASPGGEVCDPEALSLFPLLGWNIFDNRDQRLHALAKEPPDPPGAERLLAVSRGGDVASVSTLDVDCASDIPNGFSTRIRQRVDVMRQHAPAPLKVDSRSAILAVEVA